MRPALAVAALFPAAAALACVAPPKGDPERGRTAFQKCYACHDLAPGNDVSGPSLHAIVGRPVAARPGYDYSAALETLAGREPAWTPDLLDRFIADPEAVAPGTGMTFTGMRNAQERADLIAYLAIAGSRP